jgi:hypothetical protein
MAPTMRPPSESARIAHLFRDDTRPVPFRSTGTRTRLADDSRKDRFRSTGTRTRLGDDSRPVRFRSAGRSAGFHNGGPRAGFCNGDLWAGFRDGGLWFGLARQMAGQGHSLGKFFYRQRRPHAEAERHERAGHAAASGGRGGDQSPHTDAGYDRDHVSGQPLRDRPSPRPLPFAPRMCVCSHSASTQRPPARPQPAPAPALKCVASMLIACPARGAHHLARTSARPPEQGATTSAPGLQAPVSRHQPPAAPSRLSSVLLTRPSWLSTHRSCEVDSNFTC